jgi:hypothetical protein
MARYLGIIKGSRGEATRLGHRSMVANVNSWHAGIRVEVEPTPCDGRDQYDIRLTGGSGCSGRSIYVMTVRHLPGGGFEVSMPADDSGNATFKRIIPEK